MVTWGETCKKLATGRFSDIYLYVLQILFVVNLEFSEKAEGLCLVVAVTTFSRSLFSD